MPNQLPAIKTTAHHVQDKSHAEFQWIQFETIIKHQQDKKRREKHDKLDAKNKNWEWHCI